jgi:internalin A
MTSCVRIVLIPVLVVASVTWAAGEEKNAEQEEAIAAIKKMNGYVDVDAKRPGKPVIRVHLFGGKTAGIGLAPLAKLPEIEWIGLHESDITEADLEYLKGLTKLRRLGLADTRLSDEGLKRLEGMTTLETLYLMENPITDAGLDHLQKLTNLKELGLGQTKITDAGLERLKTFKELQVLDLQRLSITDAGLNHLKSLTKLQKLDLTGCNKVRDLESLRGHSLTSLNLFDCRQVHDLTPLAGMNLSEIYLTPKNFTKDGLEVIRQCKTLKTIVIGYKGSDRLAAQDFWKKFDAGDFKP